MKEIMTNPDVVYIILSVLGVLWTKFKVSQFYQNRRNEMMDKIVVCAENAVHTVNDTFMRNIKQDLPDNPARKPTPAECTQAFDMAWQHTLESAKTEGIDALKVVGPAILKNIIEKKVEQKKQAPASVVGMLP